MKNTLIKYALPSVCFCSLLLIFISCGPNYTIEDKETIRLIHHTDGPTLGYHKESGVTHIIKEGKAFKDSNKNNQIEPYENWELPIEERVKDLAQRLSVEEIAGLMLYSSHQSIPGSSRGFTSSTYDGKPYRESGKVPSALSDQQMKFFKEDYLRHVLITQVESPAVSAQWNNNAQAYVESLGYGIPVNISSDPRNRSIAETEYNAGAGGQISMWPTTLGIAATFNADLMYQFGEIASQEYRALGIATALSPQIDLATEPRWSRFTGTMGEDPKLATDLARAYVDGFQSTHQKGWGNHSVNAMVKHWPGGGPEEGGRDGHYGYGAYAVYPGNNLSDHLMPFVEGAFKLKGETKMASAIMPYYTISKGLGNEAVGNGYNFYVLTSLLREKYKYEGVICTDWGITRDVSAIDRFEGKPWGVELLSEAQRHYKALVAGVDQFGGNNNLGPVLEAYQMGVNEIGEAPMRERFEASAIRLLLNIFQTGLFENPYLDIPETTKTVGNSTFMTAGYEAQLRSVVLLKNKNKTLPLEAKKKVYIPKRYIAPSVSWFGNVTPEREEDPFNLDIVSNYYTVVTDPQEADFALVGIESPNGGVGYDAEDVNQGGNGYVPISLQYKPYTASSARKTSLAGGSPLENFTDRSYYGKTVKTKNETDLELITTTHQKMGDKPVIVIMRLSNPAVPAEFEKITSALLVHMGVQDQALMEILSGNFEPSGLLPFQMPKDMITVEQQYEDVPRDMIPYEDSEGNSYDFAFGLNWKGVIKDERVKKYQ